MIEFDKDHSSTWIEMMSAYQVFRAKLFDWVNEPDQVKQKDLLMELGSWKNRDLHRRLLVVDFLQKPDGDATQENLINRLERLIFQVSMVANISDENFGTSSGIALKYKLQAMSNLAKTKERKFASMMNRRYKLIFSNPVSGMRKEDWLSLRYQFTLNYPANVLEEAQIAAQLSGVVSRETQLKVLSVVDDVREEIQRIEEEQDMTGYSTDYPTGRAADDLLGTAAAGTESGA